MGAVRVAQPGGGRLRNGRQPLGGAADRQKAVFPHRAGGARIAGNRHPDHVVAVFCAGVEIGLPPGIQQHRPGEHFAVGLVVPDAAAGVDELEPLRPGQNPPEQ